MGGSLRRFASIILRSIVGPINDGRNKRGRKAQFTAELTLYESFFTGASGIDGEVVLTVTSPVAELKGVWVELVTQTAAPITDAAGGCTLFDIRPKNPNVVIAGKAWPEYDDPEKSMEYARGSYAFSFHVSLNQVNIPPTMDNHLGCIQHSLALVSVSDHKWRILNCRQVITLSGSNNLATLPRQPAPSAVRASQPKSTHETRTSWPTGPLLSSRDGLQVTMQLAKQGFLPSDTIEGFIKAENPRGSILKEIQVQVANQIMYHHSIPKYSTPSIVAKERIVVGNNDRVGETQLAVFSLQLPPKIHPTWVTNDKMMMNVYTVHFQVKTTDGIQVRGAQNITIGTHDVPENSAVPSGTAILWSRTNIET